MQSYGFFSKTSPRDSLFFDITQTYPLLHHSSLKLSPYFITNH